MRTDLDVNPAFDEWKSSTESEKDLKLKELVRRIERFTRAICWQRIPDLKGEHDAIASAVAWRTVQGLQDFKGDSKFSTWVYTIVLNEVNRCLRKRKECLETSLEEGDAVTTDARTDDKVDLESLTSGLNRQERLLTELVLGGYTFKEIAKVFSVPLNTALSRWHDLKRKLRDANKT